MAGRWVAESSLQEASMRTWIVISLTAAGVAFAAPTQAQISAELAKQCREMMVKAHPMTAHATAMSAADQRAYFQDCIRRNGKLPEASEPATTTGAGPDERR